MNKEEIYNYSKIFLELKEERLNKFKELSIYPTFLFYGYPTIGKSSVANIIDFLYNLKKERKSHNLI